MCGESTCRALQCYVQHPTSLLHQYSTRNKQHLSGQQFSVTLVLLVSAQALVVATRSIVWEKRLCPTHVVRRDRDELF